MGNNLIGDIMLGASAALIVLVATTFLLFCFGEPSLWWRQLGPPMRSEEPAHAPVGSRNSNPGVTWAFPWTAAIKVDGCIGPLQDV